MALNPHIAEPASMNAGFPKALPIEKGRVDARNLNGAARRRRCEQWNVGIVIITKPRIADTSACIFQMERPALIVCI